MGTAVSRDHAKLPFGYTHARKDHSYNTSSVSRRRLASRLLRTSDTTSVTPFPIQDGASSVASIPELVSLPPIPLNLNLSLHLHEPPSTSSHQSVPAPLSSQSYSYSPSSSSAVTAGGATFAPTYHSYSHSYSYGYSHSANNDNQHGAGHSSISVPDSGTGATTGTIATSSTITGAVPDSDETAIRSTRSRNLTGSSLSHSRSLLHPHAHSHPHVHHKATIVAGDHLNNSYGHYNNNNSSSNNNNIASSPSGSSLAWTSTHQQHQTGMTNPNMAQAQTQTIITGISSTQQLNGQVCVPSSSSGYEQEQYGVRHRKSQSFRSQVEQSHNNDMDIISALGIADRPYQSSYDFFSSTGSTPSPPRSLGLQQQSSTQAQQVQSQQYYHHSATLTKRDSMALLLSSSSSRTVGQEDYETRTSICAVASECQGHHHDSYRRTLSYELKDEDDDEYADMEDGGILKIEADSVLDEDLENLSPIPFSDLPSLTNIGLCSHGIVKLSSNIRLLASATCVQICCNELSRIPVEIGFLRNLTLLDLSKNRLTSLPETIKHLSKLVDLKLSFNQLESIPAGIGGLTKLAALYLDNNRLESIPSHIGQIKGLVNLDLSDNPITVLPAEVGKLQFLRRLKLDRCPLKEEFVHSPLHSPPTLLELAARVIVRHEVPIPSLLLPHLKTYLRSARKCTFCDGPYFDSWVKRGKMIEKNDVFIPLEYTLCQPHWNTEMERVKLLFCQRPITSPPPKNNAASASSSSSSPSSSQQQQQQLRGNQSMAKRQQQNTTLPSSTFSSSSPNSGSSSTGNAASGTQKVVATTSSDSAYASASTSASPSPSEATQPLPTVRPRRARNTVEGGERQRPMSLFTNRLSMLLKPKAERREERPTSTIVMGTSTPSTAGGGGSGTTDITLTRPGPSSSSQAEILPGSPSSSTTISAVVENSRPTTTRAATSTFLKRAGLKMRRPLSMGSALEGPTSEIVGTIPRIPTTTRPTTRTLTPESLRRV